MKPTCFARFVVVVLSSFALSLPLIAADTGSSKTKTTTTGASSSTKSGKVDINTADLATLETLPGVGPQTAKAIIAARPFASVNDLAKVQGIGAAKLEELRSKVTASKVAAQKTTPAAAKEKTASSSANKSAGSKSTPADTAKSAPSGPKIDINTADAATLATLPGVGPQTAKAIIAARPFASVDDLTRVSGIGPAKLDDLRGRVMASQKKAVAAKDRTTTQKRTTASTARSEPGGTTVAPSSPYEPSSAPSATEQPLTPTGRTDTARSGSSTPRVASAGTTQGLVNLNTATLQELEALPEIGPVKAQAIIEARPFSSIEDVMRVKGIKEGTFAAIKDKITVR